MLQARVAHDPVTEVICSIRVSIGVFQRSMENFCLSYTAKPKPGITSSRYFGFELPNLTTSSSLVQTPAHCRNSSNGRTNKLDDKDGPQFRRVNQQQWQLNYPKEEVRAHPLGGDAGIGWQVIWNVIVARRPRTKHHGDTLRS